MAKKKKPGRLPGMEEFVDKELDEQFDDLFSKEKKKHKATLDYTECHAIAMDLLKKKGVTSYRHENSGRLWVAEATVKIKHKNLKDREEADDDDEDEGKGIVSDKNATDSLDEDPRPAKLKNAEKAREAKGEEVPG